MFKSYSRQSYTSPIGLYSLRNTRVIIAFWAYPRYTSKVNLSAFLTRTRHQIFALANWANKHEALLLLLLLVLILRIPTFSAPYWYGDEAIYLTVGNALRHGQLLYAQIVDHKTPLIYYFAAVPNQLWFRILMTSWLLTSTVFFFNIAKQLFKKGKGAFISTLLFVLGTNLPLLEGNIPNGELFVIGFILTSLWLLTKTSFWQALLDEKKWYTTSKKDYIMALLAGLLAGGGLLTKVPALLDIAALGSIFLWWLVVALGQRVLKQRGRRASIMAPLGGGIIFSLGFIIPILVSVLYYFLRGTLDAYLQFGLLYNFHYTGNWTVPISTNWIAALFELKWKVVMLALAGIVSMLLLFKQKTNWKVLWLGWWMFLALFASLLSNRPYPHYFMQLVPPLSLLLVALVVVPKAVTSKLMASLSLLLAIAAFILLDFSPYPVVKYYQRYYLLVSGKISKQEYQQEFNYLVKQNTEIAQVIVDNSAPEDHLFIWGTNPMLYALTGRVPASRFTVAFHIHDLEVYKQTLQEIKAYQPSFIVVMKNEQPWPELEEYIRSKYIFVTQTDHLKLYRRSNLTSLELLQ